MTNSTALARRPSGTRTCASSRDALAADVGLLLAELPVHLDVRREPFPQLSALRRAAGLDATRRLLCLAAQAHVETDERRTAEYLLRHRHEIREGRRTAAALVAAARFAADCDVRLQRNRTTPVGVRSLDDVAREVPAARVHDPSVGEVVLGALVRATGRAPATDLARTRLLDAVVVAVELAEAHRLRGGALPSLIAMRSNARPHARLVARLVSEFEDETAARSLAHLLVGGVRTPITSALLWWAAQPNLDLANVPEQTRRRWAADLSDADPAIRALSPRRSRRDARVLLRRKPDSQVPGNRRVAHTRQKGLLACRTVQTCEGRRSS